MHAGTSQDRGAAVPVPIDPRLLRVRLRTALLLVAYLLGVFLFFEAVARGVLSVRDLRHRLETDDDTSHRLEWVRRQNRTRRLFYSFDIHHPTRGWAVKPSVRDLVAFDNGAVVNSNSDGVRGRQEYARPKPPGAVRILVLGDSFTFGDEVGDDESYPAVLQTMLPGAEVVNLGVHGYGHDQMLLYLKEVGGRYEPDVVLLGFVYLDMARNLLGFRDFAKPRFTLAGEGLVLHGTPVPTPDRVRLMEPFRPKIVDLLSLLYHRTPGWSAGRLADAEALTASILDEFRRTAGSLRATPFVVYLPIEGELTAPISASIPEEQFFWRYCRDREVPALDLHERFLSQGARAAEFRRAGHWGPLEHRIAAGAIAESLVQRHLVPSTATARQRPAW